MSALETFRQPIFLLLTSACVVLISVTPMVLLHKFGEEGKLARDTGLALHFVFGIFVAGTAAAASLAREVRSGTAATVLCKPVGRDMFFLAKYAGLLLIVMGFSACATIATLMAERIAEKFMYGGGLIGDVIDWRTAWTLLAAPAAAMAAAAVYNYVTRRPFGSAAFFLLLIALMVAMTISGFFDRGGRRSAFDLIVEWRILPAALLVTFALGVLSAVALSLSTRLRAGPTVVICALLFLAGLLSDYFFGRFVDRSIVAAFCYAVIPNWQHFWLADALNGGGAIPPAYLLRAAGYATTVSAGVLCLGALAFRGTDIT